MRKALHFHRVSDLMQRRGVDVDWLADHTGLYDRVAKAIYHQRYTPSPRQRRRVAEALNTAREHIIWGHAVEVEALK